MSGAVLTSAVRAPRTASAFLQGIAVLAVALIWVALLAGMLGRRGWLLELLSHFRLHYVGAFFVLAVVTIWMRRTGAAIAAAIGFAVSAAPMLPYIESSATQAVAAGERFRIVSFNVMFWNRNPAPFARYLERTNADAVFLQEVTPDLAQALPRLLPSYPHAYIDPDWRGAAMLSRWPIVSAEWKPLAEAASRGALVRIDWRGQRIALLGVHLHWPMASRQARLRDQQLAALASYARGAAEPLIVAGDFNVTPWSPKYRDFVEQSGLIDASLGQGLTASWPSPLTWLGIRIDHCFVAGPWRVLDAHIGPHVGSDHRPLVVELALDPADQLTSQPADRQTSKPVNQPTG